MFLQKSEFRKFTIQNIEIELELDEYVFPPSPNGSFYAESLRVEEGESVIDIGTGSGILAIYAAKSGGIVSATDIDPHAIAVARRNAALNKANIEFAQGEMFASFDRKFDVIFANLPNEIVPEQYLKEIGAALTKTFDGGVLGNKYILELLEAAPRYMHWNSRLYLPVHTLTDFNQTLRAAVSHYQTKLIALAHLATKDFVEQNIHFYLKLNEAGLIRIYRHGQNWFSDGYVCELSCLQGK